MDKCPRTKKLLMSEVDAHNAMEAMRPTDPRQDLLEVYPCKAGGGDHFHVGHADVGGKTNRHLHPERKVADHLTYNLGRHMPTRWAELAGGRR